MASKAGAGKGYAVSAPVIFYSSNSTPRFDLDYTFTRQESSSPAQGSFMWQERQNLAAAKEVLRTGDRLL